MFVCSDPSDFLKPYKETEMSKIVEQYVNSILLNVTLPPNQKTDDNDTAFPSELVIEGTRKTRGILVLYFS